MGKLAALKLLADIVEVGSRAYGNVMDKVLAKDKVNEYCQKDAEIKVLKDQIIRLEKDSEIKALRQRIEELEKEKKA